MGVFWWMVDLFKTLLETVERLMYSVDEWLRFKSGDSQFLFAMKVVLGLVWSAVAYVLRFCVNLLIEPQINPIKHFPVVTVSHKLLLPLISLFGRHLCRCTWKRNWPIPRPTVIIWCIPGIFGFLVWELKENWRLYAANRPKGLQPMIIGQPRRNDGPAAQARLPFRHDPQALRQTPPRRTQSQGLGQLEGGAKTSPRIRARREVAPPLCGTRFPRPVQRKPRRNATR